MTIAIDLGGKATKQTNKHTTSFKILIFEFTILEILNFHPLKCCIKSAARLYLTKQEGNGALDRSPMSCFMRNCQNTNNLFLVLAILGGYTVFSLSIIPSTFQGFVE